MRYQVPYEVPGPICVRCSENSPRFGRQTDDQSMSPLMHERKMVKKTKPESRSPRDLLSLPSSHRTGKMEVVVLRLGVSITSWLDTKQSNNV